MEGGSLSTIWTSRCVRAADSISLMYSIVSVTWEQLRFAPERLYYRVIDLVQKMRRLPNTGVLESSRL